MLTLSTGIPCGLVLSLVGTILVLTTRYKMIALLVLVAGVAIIVLTIILIALAVSQM